MVETGLHSGGRMASMAGKVDLRLEGYHRPDLHRSILIRSFAIEDFRSSHANDLHGVEQIGLFFKNFAYILSSFLREAEILFSTPA